MVSKVFANEDFGYRKVTVERPLRLNFAATEERMARIEEERSFQNLAKSREAPRPGARRRGRRGAGAAGGDPRSAARAGGGDGRREVMRDREAFAAALRDAAGAAGLRLSACGAQGRVVRAERARPGGRGRAAIAAEIAEPDTDLRDTETVPLREDIDAYMAREVLPHVPDAWVDASKTKIGYEIPLNRHFYVYEPPRPLDAIKSDLQQLEREIARPAGRCDGVRAIEKLSRAARAGAR